MEDEKSLHPKPVVGITVADVSSQGTGTDVLDRNPGWGKSQQLMTQALCNPIWMSQEVRLSKGEDG